MALITIKNLSVYYNHYLALDNIDFEVREKDYIGIIGPNGSGKTTLLKTILGDIKPDKGNVIVESNIVIGYVPQFSTFNADFPIKVFDVVLSGTLPSTIQLFHSYKKKNKDEVLSVCDRLNIRHLANKQINQLSGGQLQKVLLARALVTNPDILLLDEPTASLDTDAKEDIYNILTELNNEITIIMVSHDIGMIKHNVKTFACLNKTLHVHKNDENLDLEHFGSLF